MDRGRDGATCLRRRRRAVGGRLPHLQDDRLDVVGTPDRRRRDGRTSRTDAPTPPPGGPLAGGQPAGLRATPGRTTAGAGHPRAVTPGGYFPWSSGTRRPTEG